MLKFQFLAVGSHRGVAGKRRISDGTTPSRRIRRRSSLDSMINDDHGLNGFQRTDNINGASSSSDDNGIVRVGYYIPEWLILNILIRLPSKFVVRCKLVSKQWASLISHPFFARTYLSHSPSSSWTVIGERMGHTYPGKVEFIEYGMPKYTTCSRQNFGLLCLPPTHELDWREDYNVLGTSNGLILFSMVRYHGACPYIKSKLLYVCNPTTRKLIPLSPPPREFLTECDGSGFVARVEDAVLKSFRVVLWMRDDEPGCLRSTVYASETCEWSQEFIFSSGASTQYIWEKRPTALNQILHWNTDDGPIIAYDPYKNPPHIRIIEPPKVADPDLKLGHRCLCGASEGKLRYSEMFVVTVDEDTFAVRLRLWVLEDYALGGTWRMSHQSDDTRILIGQHVVPRGLLSSDLTPMFFDPFDSDVLYLEFVYFLLSYDVRRGKFGVVLRDRVPRSEAVLLELSPWPISIAPCSSAANI